MHFRLLPMLVVLLTTSGCLKGVFNLKHGDCEAGQAKTKFGNCAAVAAPTVTISTSASLTNANPILVTAIFSQEVEDFSANGVMISNASVASVGGEGNSYILSITPIEDGEITLSLNAGAAKNFAGTPSAASNQLSFTYDGTAPTLSFVSMDRSAIDMSSMSDPTLNLQLSEAAKVILYKDETCSVSISAATDLQGTNGQTIKVDGIDRVSKTRIHGKAIDSAGNASACTSLTTYSHILKFVDPNPGANNDFGQQIVELSNGNVVITSPQATVNGVPQAGAVYLFNGDTGALISTLHGSTASDQVGGGVSALLSGNFVVSTPQWDCPGTGAPYCASLVTDAGAATFVNGSTGVSGPVTADNSLIGSTNNDRVAGVTVLTNGNYVVSSHMWDCPAGWHASCPALVTDAGMVAWANGTTGISGPVTSSNSLFGTTAFDRVSISGVTALANGNYVVGSEWWDCPGTGAPTNCSSTVVHAGAATFGSGVTGISGPVTAANSLIGSTNSDQVGLRITALVNGNYVVRSAHWDCLGTGAPYCASLVTNAGAVTFGSGTTGISGPVTALNSLIGASNDDRVGWQMFIALSNGNYVVGSERWDCPGTGAPTNCASTLVDAGAATFGSGVTGITGPVTAANSLIGSTNSDQVGLTLTALANGNYVVGSPNWDCPGTGVPNNCASLVTNAGAATFGNGATGISGIVSAANSLIGSSSGDQVGLILALTNGNYVVRSIYWDCPGTGLPVNCSSAVTDAGAITFGNGTTGISGTVSAANSLVGSTDSDRVGSGVFVALTNGNYVVGSRYWDCPGTGVPYCASSLTDAGAVTFGSGVTGVSGPVTADNSLIGSASGDTVGWIGLSYPGINALANGNYIVRSPNWDCQASLGCLSSNADVGAVTFGDGATGITGPVNTSNSLVSSAASDKLGNSTATATRDGGFIFRSSAYSGNMGLVIKIPGDDGIAGSL